MTRLLEPLRWAALAAALIACAFGLASRLGTSVVCAAVGWLLWVARSWIHAVPTSPTPQTQVPKGRPAMTAAPDAPSLDDNPTLDSPEHFADAARALATCLKEPVSAHHLANGLAWLARCGYIVSAAEHERRCEEYTAQLQRVEQAADELVARLHGAGEVA